MDFFTTLLGPLCHICNGAVELQSPACSRCLKQMQSFHLDSRYAPDHLPEHIAAVCRYEGWAKDFVTSQKRQPHQNLLRWMAMHLKKACPQYWRQRTVVWVPPSRLSALHLVEALVLELNKHGFKSARVNPLKRRVFPSQFWKKQKQRDRRQRSIASSSTYTCQPLDSTLAGQDLLLLDDVTTTGVTLEACIAALQEQGAGHVATLVFAATPLKSNSKHKKKKGIETT